MHEPHLLVVDDHRDIRDPLAAYLRRNGLRVSVAAEAAVARTLLATNAIDLVILDVMMPGEDGLSLCRFIREAYDLPVVILTAVADQIDRIVGLELGADDYVTKPFDPRELLARVRNLIRRAGSLPRQRGGSSAHRFAFARLTLDVGRRQLIDANGREVQLSTGELHLLEALVRRPRIVLTRAQLKDLTGARSAEGSDRGIDNQVSRLRRKLEDAGGGDVIKTVWGGGYVLAADVSEVG